ncbi:MAG: PAS domain S-box protein, partial [Synergistaceae bacterium]|nr:PAS domain S-box protein [Synergistaceae bacterium]
ISFDGTDLLVTVRGLKDLEGKFSGAAFVSLDLTEQRKNTARVRFLSSIVENSLNEIYVLDPHMLRFEYANRGALEALGLRPGEILGRTPLDIAPNLTREQLLERIAPICSERQETVSFVEQHGNKSDGSLYEVFLRLQGFGEGADRKIVAMGLDLSRRVRTLSTLRETNAMLAQLFENAPVGMFYCDKEGRILKVNRAALRMFGYRKGEVLKRTVEEILVPEADREISLGHWKTFFGEGRSILLEATRRKKDGSSLPIRVIGIPVFVKGEAKGAYLLYVDLTAEREARKATERLNRLLEAQVREERRVWEETIKVLARATELRDPYTAGHQRRVASLARAIAEEIGMEPEACHRVEMAATIHDVGKIEVPSEILVKPGALSPLERGLIQLHCEAGREILEDVVLSWPLAGDRLPAPRAPGRLGIPAGPERRRDSPRGPDYRGSRHCRGHGLAPALPSREGHRRSHGGNRAWAWSPIRSRRV